MRHRPNVIAMRAGVPRRDSQTLNGRIPGGSCAASDSFNDRTALGSTDGYWYDTGAGIAWNAAAGTWGCAAGFLTPTGSSPGGTGWWVSCDPGVLLHQMWVDVAQLSGSSSGPAVRFTDKDNCYEFVLATAGCQWFEFNGGVATARGTATTGVTIATGDSVLMTVNGSTLTSQVFRNGLAVGTAASWGSASLHTSATAIGFRSTSTGSKYDNFRLARL